VISVTENSNKFQKTRFWKEKSVEYEFTLGSTAQNTLVWVMDKVINMSLLVSLLKIAAPPVTGMHSIFWMKKNQLF